MMSNIKDLGINLLGWRTKRRLIIFESDDWGNVRLPSQEAYDILSAHKSIEPNPYYLYDSLESNSDLEILFETLSAFKDFHGNHPVFTANFITALPDYKKIEQNEFRSYYYKPLIEVLSENIKRDKVFRLWIEGIKRKIFLPQLHGREHFDVKRWMAALRDGDFKALDGFRNKSVIISESKNTDKRNGITAAFDYDKDEEIDELGVIIKDAVKLFYDLFGYYSASFIAPAYTWGRQFEKHLANEGIKYIQTLVYQTEPVSNSKKKYRKIFHYLGQKNIWGQCYLVRNCFFEPSIVQNYDWVNDCLRRISLAFTLHKPAIIGTHRVNYMGVRNFQNRETSIKSLNQLLSCILKNWTDAEFLSSEQLGHLIADSNY